VAEVGPGCFQFRKRIWRPTSLVQRYQRFGGTCCLHLQGRSEYIIQENEDRDWVYERINGNSVGKEGRSVKVGENCRRKEWEGEGKGMENKEERRLKREVVNGSL
jgi:hypothetical protein